MSDLLNHALARLNAVADPVDEDAILRIALDVLPAVAALLRHDQLVASMMPAEDFDRAFERAHDADVCRAILKSAEVDS